jgi:hypothetical protein
MATKTAADHKREKFFEEQFRWAAGEHLAWQISSVDLLRAVNILNEEIKKDWRRFKRGSAVPWTAPFKVCMMLCGLMLEDLLKALLVSRTAALDSKGQFAHKTHDLLKLAKLVGLKLSQDESILLEKLTRFVEWAGRYPIPLRFQPPQTRNTGTSIRMGKGGGDIEAAKRMAKRLARMLPAQMQALRPATRRTRRGRNQKP